jgi:site-specific recombinase XerC
MPKLSSPIIELAGHGAKARLRELADEAKVLFELFPHLHDSFDKDELPISFIVAKGSGRLTKRNVVRRPRRMSAAARKAVGLRMKKYWAARRKAKKA